MGGEFLANQKKEGEERDNWAHGRHSTLERIAEDKNGRRLETKGEEEVRKRRERNGRSQKKQELLPQIKYYN